MVGFGNLDRTLSKNLFSAVIRGKPESLAEPTENGAQANRCRNLPELLTIQIPNEGVDFF